MTTPQQPTPPPPPASPGHGSGWSTPQLALLISGMLVCLLVGLLIGILV